MSKLKGEITFGMNRIYLMFPELGFRTTYLSVVNDLVIEQTAADLAALDMPKFLSWRSRKFFSPDLQPSFNIQPANLPLLHLRLPRFSPDVRGRIWEGATVTYVTMQLAFHMGISEVYLIGVDHNYDTKGKPNTTITSDGDDPNHFHAGYFGKGFRWQLPDLETSEIAYRMARQAYENAGRRIAGCHRRRQTDHGHAACWLGSNATVVTDVSQPGQTLCYGARQGCAHLLKGYKDRDIQPGLVVNLALLGGMLVAVVARLANWNLPLGHDEAYMYNAFASRSFWHIVTNYHLPNNHVLLSLIIKIVTALLGNHVWSLRLPTLVTGVMMVPVAYFVRKAVL
jgi:hypothetical protein